MSDLISKIRMTLQPSASCGYDAQTTGADSVVVTTEEASGTSAQRSARLSGTSLRTLKPARDHHGSAGEERNTSHRDPSPTSRAAESPGDEFEFETGNLPAMETSDAVSDGASTLSLDLDDGPGPESDPEPGPMPEPEPETDGRTELLRACHLLSETESSIGQEGIPPLSPAEGVNSVQGIQLLNQNWSAPGLHQVAIVIECYITVVTLGKRH